jgi:hypothetical protein
MEYTDSIFFFTRILRFDSHFYKGLIKKHWDVIEDVIPDNLEYSLDENGLNITRIKLE